MLWIFDRDLNQEGQSIRRLYDDGSRTFSYVNIQVVSNNNNIEEGIPIPYKDKTVIMTCNNDYDVKGVDSQFDRIHTVFHNIHTTNPKIFSDEILFFQSLNVS
jgi:hypothetical protein